MLQERLGNTGGQSIQDEPLGHRGVIKTAVRRTLEDQKGLYEAPFEPRNFKWDGLVLGGTAFLVAQCHIENTLPGTHHRFYHDTSNVAIGGLTARLAGVWLCGVKTEHRHARENRVSWNWKR